jgi:hypothetical protein
MSCICETRLSRRSASEPRIVSASRLAFASVSLLSCLAASAFDWASSWIRSASERASSTIWVASALAAATAALASLSAVSRTPANRFAISSYASGDGVSAAASGVDGVADRGELPPPDLLGAGEQGQVEVVLHVAGHRGSPLGVQGQDARSLGHIILGVKSTGCNDRPS